MKKEIALGQIREILTLAGSLVWGMNDGVVSIVGSIVAVLSVAWSLYHNDGMETVFSAARKALSLFPALALQFNWIAPDKAAILTSMIAPISAMVWSAIAKGATMPTPSKFPMIILLGVCLVIFSSLISCTPFLVFDPESDPNDGELRAPISGVVIRKKEDGGAKAVIDSTTVKNLIGRIISAAK